MWARYFVKALHIVAGLTAGYVFARGLNAIVNDATEDVSRRRNDLSELGLLMNKFNSLEQQLRAAQKQEGRNAHEIEQLETEISRLEQEMNDR